MNETVIKVERLVKRYGAVTAVNGLSLEVKKGEVLGLLGPNGAGKTTTLECIEGLRSPSEGSIEILGLHPQKNSAQLRRVLGVQLQASALPETMRVGEAMALVCAWHKCRQEHNLLERFDLLPLAKRQYRQLSTGQKRRLQLALALVGSPRAVILDEPTAGLDVQGRADLHGLIRSLKDSGVTMLLATHDMAEAESLCDRIAIVIGGRLAVLGTPEQVTAAGSSETRITIRTREGRLLGQNGVSKAVYMGESEGYAQWRCQDTVGAVTELLRKAEEQADTVEDLRVQRPSLEERFLEIVQGGNNT